jgi:phosphatidate cytidylyltransferase
VRKLLERLLIFLIGIPLFISLVLFLPQKNHLALNIVIIVLSALGSRELADMLAKKGLSINRWEAFFLGAFCPAGETFAISFLGMGGPAAELPMSFAFFITTLSWILVSRIFAPPDTLDDGLNRITAGIVAVCYPGLFMLPLIRMGAFSTPVLLAFLLIVFGNDSVAWAAGMLFGKNNRGVIPASPNKSVAGFIGGFAAAVAAGILAAYFAPGAFTGRSLPSLLAGAILGLISAAAASLGDLAESVMKRSAGIKDSGNLIPGRGGVLDSLDSVAFAAPIFYGLYRLLFI